MQANQQPEAKPTASGRLTASDRLSLALMAMDQFNKAVYWLLVAYCEKVGKSPHRITGKDLGKILSEELAKLAQQRHRLTEKAKAELGI